MTGVEEYPEIIAEIALSIGAIKLNPENPFQWASGFRMPIYNDNRMLLWSIPNRQRVAAVLSELVRETFGSDLTVIAGTSTAGIPWATMVADKTKNPLIYIRDKPKDHGLRNQIEGIDAQTNLNRYSVVVIEDLISTGGSSAAAVQAVRDAEGSCNHCFSIFNYGFKEAQEMFEGTRPYNREGTRSLIPPCQVRSVLTYDALLRMARKKGYIDSTRVKMLEEWRADPFGWGEKRGFPRVVQAKN
jgi:orotate phosphoribosyltransferase